MVGSWRPRVLPLSKNYDNCFVLQSEGLRPIHMGRAGSRHILTIGGSADKVITYGARVTRSWWADVAAVMDPEFADMTSQDTPFLTVDSDALALLDLNEVSQSDILTAESYGCYSNDQRIAPFVIPGESVEGLVVLDTDLEHGYLVYNPWGVEGSGWRWEF